MQVFDGLSNFRGFFSMVAACFQQQLRLKLSPADETLKVLPAACHHLITLSPEVRTSRTCRCIPVPNFPRHHRATGKTPSECRLHEALTLRMLVIVKIVVIRRECSCKAGGGLDGFTV